MVEPGRLEGRDRQRRRRLLAGAQRLADDVSRPPRLPIRSEAGQFKLGEEVAATPGSVVLRTPVMELIQYDPVTPEVKAEPVLFVPSLVNKYYLTDLSPGRSWSSTRSSTASRRSTSRG